MGVDMATLPKQTDEDQLGSGMRVKGTCAKGLALTLDLSK